MNQELMTLDFWQDTVIYEGKIFPIGTLACDALNVPADTLARMNEQCEKIKFVGCRGRNPCCPLETEIQDQTKKENRHRNLRIPSRLRRRMGPDFI